MLSSLALQTTLIYNQYFSKINEKDKYIVVKTKNRPDYYWGNYVIIKGTPNPNSLDQYVDIYTSEFRSQKNIDYYTITFDSDVKPNFDFQNYLDAGFSVDITESLIASKLKKPRNPQIDIDIRPLASSNDWHQYIDVHYSENWGYGTSAEQKKFLENEYTDFRKLTMSGKAIRMGAFTKDHTLIADLGLFWDGKIARFHNVATHRNYQNLGVCKHLVYSASQYVKNNYGIKLLIIEADQNSIAYHIYKSLGFTQHQKQVYLEKTLQK